MKPRQFKCEGRKNCTGVGTPVSCSCGQVLAMCPSCRFDARCGKCRGAFSTRRLYPNPSQKCSICRTRKAVISCPDCPAFSRSHCEKCANSQKHLEETLYERERHERFLRTPKGERPYEEHLWGKKPNPDYEDEGLPEISIPAGTLPSLETFLRHHRAYEHTNEGAVGFSLPPETLYKYLVRVVHTKPSEVIRILYDVGIYWTHENPRLRRFQ